MLTKSNLYNMIDHLETRVSDAEDTLVRKERTLRVQKEQIEVLQREVKDARCRHNRLLRHLELKESVAGVKLVPKDQEEEEPELDDDHSYRVHLPPPIGYRRPWAI